jgi:methylthioxylose transferase
MPRLARSGTARRLRDSPGAALVAAVSVVALLTIGVGAVLVVAGGDIGAPLPPTLFRFRPDASVYSVLAAALLVGGVLVARRLYAPSVSAGAFAAGALGLALLLRLSLNAARDGPVDWWIFFDPRFGEGTVEYLAALPALDFGVTLFLDRFAETADGLPVHAVGHPPGLLTVVALLGLDTAPAFAALIIAVGVLSVPLVYALGRELLDDDRQARAATLLYVFAPSALLYGASAADALFATLAMVAAIALVARGQATRVVGGPAALAVASFFSYANVAVAAWAALVAFLREGWRSALRLAAAVAAGLVIFYVVLYAATGFDVLGAIATTGDVYRVSLARIRPYPYFVFGSPVAWLLAMGLPLAYYWLRSIAARQAAALALAAVVVLSALAGFTKAETERIWLFLVPLACVGAAAALPGRRLVAVLALLALQAFLMQHLLGTVW